MFRYYFTYTGIITIPLSIIILIIIIIIIIIVIIIISVGVVGGGGVVFFRRLSCLNDLQNTDAQRSSEDNCNTANSTVHDQKSQCHERQLYICKI